MTPGELRGVVAVDGPSGTGKSTVARGLAARLGARYLDTGAMYRAVTLAVLRAGIDPASTVEVGERLIGLRVVVGTDPALSTVRLDGVEVAAEIRGERVTGAVSAVSALPVVRAVLVDRQREIIDRVLASDGGIVVEGRDIGTVVVPDAPLKVYLTASAAVRAQRRSEQDRLAGRPASLAGTLDAVRRRDASDTGRAVSPLRVARDAVTLDNSELDIEATVEAMLTLVAERGLGAVPERT